jgi:hypothetical protein
LDGEEPQNNTPVSFDDRLFVINEDDGDGEEALVRDFDADGTQGAEDLLGFDEDGLEDDTEEEEWDLADDGTDTLVYPVRD